MLGEVVLSDKITGKTTFSLEVLPKGVYTIFVDSEGGNYTEKIVIQ